MIFTLIAVTLFFGALSMRADINSPALVVMFLVMIILASFMSLNVTINEHSMQIKFGYGIFKKRFLLREIASAKTVKNHWYYGWGIRLLLCPTMWLYNVSGFDAVEITMKDGKKYRIGTDEPKILEHAIALMLAPPRA
jgi:hypothetical protein